MKILLLLLPLLNLGTFSVAETFEKIEGTSGDYYDIVIDSDNKWYIVRDKQLYHSLDNGKTLIKIELPSKELVHSGLGIDQYNNIYVQDYKLSVFIVAPQVNESFIFEELELVNGKEKLVSRPFSLGDNVVYLATKTSIMELENSALTSKNFSVKPYTPKEITQLIRSNVSERYGESYEVIFYSVKGAVRNWIYSSSSSTSAPLCQTKGPVRHLSVVNDRVYFTVEGENDVKVINYIERPHFIPQYHRKQTYATTLEGIDALNIDDNSDFTIFSQENYYKTYIYANIGNSGVVYGIDAFISDGKNVTQVVSLDKLDNVRILCGVMQNDKLFFGTSDGVYEFKNIQPSRVST